jgi:hypothetical protein
MVIAASMNGRALKLLNEDELHNAVVDIMTEIKLVTGALMLTGNELQAQIQMVKIFLWSGFSMLTKDEIVKAFYLNMQGKYDEQYRHYNKELNAEFLGDVLRAYLKYKVYIRENYGHIIEKALPKVVGRLPPVDWDYYRELVQIEYNNCFKDIPAPMVYWDARKYIALRRFIKYRYPVKKVWLYYMKMILQRNLNKTMLPATADLSNVKFISFKQVYDLLVNKEDYRPLLDMVRRHVYYEFLTAMNTCGINKIWEEIQ